MALGPCLLRRLHFHSFLWCWHSLVVFSLPARCNILVSATLVIWLSLFVFLHPTFPLFLRHWLRGHCNLLWLVLNLTISAKILFLSEAESVHTADYLWTCLLNLSFAEMEFDLHHFCSNLHCLLTRQTLLACQIFCISPESHCLL